MEGGMEAVGYISIIFYSDFSNTGLYEENNSACLSVHREQPE